MNVPTYLRKDSGASAALRDPMMMGAAPKAGGYNPGGEDFIFAEDDFETPSFLRKSAS
jgi:hypothetical protein